jgi:2-methylcitrate dehydratase PrpD
MISGSSPGGWPSRPGGKEGMDDQKTGTGRIAQFISETEFHHLPPEAVTAAKQGVLDWLGVTFQGAREPSAIILAGYVKGLAALEESSAFCRGFMTTAEMAAWLNGTAGHAIDFDDTFANSVRYNIHPTTCVLPAAMAVVEKLGLPGKELLLAYIVGLEVEYRIGAAIGQAMPAIGWFPTPVLGTFDAASAGAKALRIGPGQARNALAIAASSTGGLKKNVETMTKVIHAGNGARNGVMEALLAQRGLTGNPAIFDGENNFCAIFTNRQVGDLAGEARDLGKEWKTVSTGLGFKPYPSCRAAHASIDAVLHLRQKYGIKADRVASITCKLNPLVLGMTTSHRPKTGYEAKFSIEYCISRALLDGEVMLQHFRDERVMELGVQAMIPRVAFVHPDGWGHGAVDLLTEIEIRMENGKSYRHRVAFPKGGA